MIAPIIKELAKKYAGKVLFRKLNVEEKPTYRYTVWDNEYTYTSFFFKNCKFMDSIVGAIPK
jgi:thiol-disulfide isomerase/thioredoxin